MKVQFNDLFNQYLLNKKNYDDAIYSVIQEGAFIGGKFASKFEREYEKHYGIKNCIGVGNGTDAIYIVLKMLGIKEGDEVITTAHSWISTSEAISQVGATPVFVDVDQYFTIDVSKIESKITQKTKAIIPVHLYGQPADIEEIMRISKLYNLFVIEDCAQAHYSEINNKRVGTFGNAATFSFYPGKNLGAYGDAGAIITNDDNLAQKCRMYANHGALKKHQHAIEGINSRLDGIQAAILSEKLNFIDKWTDERINIAKLYTDYLSDCEFVQTPLVRKNCKHVYHLYVILAKKRDQLKEFLENKGIECAIHYPKALPLLEAYNYLKSINDEYRSATNNQEMILSLPIYPEMDNIMVKYVSDSIIEFYQLDESK